VRHAFYLLIILSAQAVAADKFLGWQSCATSGCHGGGKGDDQVNVWRKLDVHGNTQGRFNDPKSLAYAKELGIGAPEKAVQCTVCHHPMAGVPKDMLHEALKSPNRGVSCETCHGPAEKWLRSHARPDFTHAQRLGLGMRALDTTYQRANACAGCHGVVPENIRKAGHPAPHLELARQLATLPPHWKDFDATQAAGAWLTGQAVMLRELCWQSEKGYDQKERIEPLHWLLRETVLGGEHLPADTAPAVLRPAADKLARAASASQWSAKRTRSLFDDLTRLGRELRGAPPAQQFARAEMVGLALQGVVGGIVTDPGKDLKDAISAVRVATGAATTFNVETFAAAVEKLAATLPK
jgi:Cytochrome c554 and c-prime